MKTGSRQAVIGIRISEPLFQVIHGSSMEYIQQVFKYYFTISFSLSCIMSLFKQIKSKTTSFTKTISSMDVFYVFCHFQTLKKALSQVSQFH